MNLVRKLKLQTLDKNYTLSKKEEQCICLINSLIKEKLSFKETEYLYILMNLKKYKFDNNLYFLDNNNNIYFRYNLSNKYLYWDYSSVEFELIQIQPIKNQIIYMFINILFEKSYNLKNKTENNNERFLNNDYYFLNEILNSDIIP